MTNDVLEDIQARKEALEAIRDEFGFVPGIVEIMAGYRTSELTLFLALFRMAKNTGISEGMKQSHEVLKRTIDEINA